MVLLKKFHYRTKANPDSYRDGSEQKHKTNSAAAKIAPKRYFCNEKGLFIRKAYLGICSSLYLKNEN